MDLGLNGQHVLITGSAGGIGLTLAKSFLSQNCKVSLHFNRNFPAEIQEILNENPNTAAAVAADVTDEAQVIAAVRQAVERFGPVHILVVNHAVFQSENVPLRNMSLGQWKHTIDVNLTGSFLFAREFLRQLKTHAATLSPQHLAELDACVVLIGSTAGKFGEALHSDYAASKSALMYGLMRSLKNEIVAIVPRGRVNTVAPGWTRTPMAEASVARGEHFRALQTTPLKKIATTAEVANAVLFLSSGVAAGHCSGTILEIDGGMEGRVLNSLEDLHA
eukprot:TRINITY_DN6561_c0_g1_i1.p1 TRINITY_DN6561_c0_g1~~TRINITY_DN6561_c0_g1_i1.p1  ORF type:complete len:277 (-),score=39.27 TRINITY_DN6561_c0_g1_i1:54-884(-)